MTGWNAVHREIRRGDLDALVALLVEESLERAEIARELGRLIRGRNQREWRAAPDGEVNGVLLTAVAAQPSSARIAATLQRRPLTERLADAPIAALLQVALARDVEWLPDLAQHLLALATPDDDGAYPFAAALLAATEAPLPDPIPSGAVVLWLQRTIDRLQAQPDRSTTAVADAMLADPIALHLAPGIVVDGVDRVLGLQVQADGRGVSLLPAGIAELAARGLLDRSQLLAGAVGRLRRGGAAADLRPFQLLIDHLAPTLAEWQPHGDDLVALTSSDVGAVVADAQRVLHRLHRHDRIATDAVVAASSSVLRHPAKGTARSALSFLERFTERDDGDAAAADIARAAAAAFPHPALDVASRALDVVARLVPRLDDATRRDLAGAAVSLDPALRERAGEVFGGPAVVTLDDTVATRDHRPRPARTPWPVRDAHPVEAARLLRGELGHDLVAWESAFADLVQLAATDPVGLRAAVDAPDAGLAAHVAGTNRPAEKFFDVVVARLLREIRAREDEEAGGLLRTVRSFLARLTDREPVETGPQPDWDAPPDRPLFPQPHLARLAEAARNLNDRPVPTLLATPTHTDGSVALDVLLERLARAARERWEPWPLDLEQALLRATLPVARAAALDAARAAHALATPAATRLARWLEQGGLADPDVTVGRVVLDPPTYDGDSPDTWLAARVTPRTPAPGPLTAALLASPAAPTPEGIGWLDLVPLPHHPEVQAAWTLPALSSHRGDNPVPTARVLTSFDGRVGPATGAALAHLLLGEAPARAVAVDVALHLTGVGQPWGAWTAQRLVDAVGHRAVLPRAVEPLRAIAAGGGAQEVLVMIVTALPPLIGSRARGLPDLLALASSLVVEVGVPEHAGPEVPEMLGLLGCGTSRSAVEARRLLDLLSEGKHTIGAENTTPG